MILSGFILHNGYMRKIVRTAKPKMKMTHTKRKAISPVLATVILIAITLVAGVAIAGFAFGLFGTLSATANVTVTTLTCTHGTAVLSACTVQLQNTGNAPASAVACSLSGLGTSVLTGAPLAINAGSSVGATCTQAPAATVPGQPVQGTFTLSSGIIISFSGTYA
jgi:flagellin-like protein